MKYKIIKCHHWKNIWYCVRLLWEAHKHQLQEVQPAAASQHSSLRTIGSVIVSFSIYLFVCSPIEPMKPHRVQFLFDCLALPETYIYILPTNILLSPTRRNRSEVPYHSYDHMIRSIHISNRLHFLYTIHSPFLIIWKELIIILYFLSFSDSFSLNNVEFHIPKRQQCQTSLKYPLVPKSF